ncbi:hypothetical protein Clacol_009117 [Clathrus columnatus]|uniref:RRM domain-containing protein n=1 Tax=Clathrus columnatus TaxID=1419009 RepID=A0AAV5AJN9_9AGAM|nr:hypothetical protein Clacol_009117 [Clathrus columnatus]
MASGYISPPPQDNPLPQDRSHPYLKEPLIYITNLAPHVAEHDIARVLEHCVPFRPNIPRDGSGRPLTGTIEFRELSSAERALATLNSRPIPLVNPPAYLYLSPFPPTNPPYVPPTPQAQPRLVKHLPLNFTDAALFDLFRPYGPLASVHVNQPGFSEPTAVVELYSEDDARAAEAGLHCTEVMDSTIAVQVYHQPRRPPPGSPSEYGVNPNAASFVPGYQQYSPPRSQYGGYSPSRASPFMHGPGQQVQFAPLHGPGANSHSGLIDPCNLFCKNLDPSIDSNELFNQFRRFGQIVSARVMRNENGQSRGFGFVSFQTPDQGVRDSKSHILKIKLLPSAASNALQGMNGIILGSKQIVVRLHEPKQLRQEKLAHRFANTSGSSHPRNRSGSGATSPTLSEGDSYWGRSSPGGPVPGAGHTDRPRRSSGSYYTAALAGNLNFSMKYDDLAALSPVVRKEILSGELSRRVKEQKEVPIAESELDQVIDALLSLSLQQVVDTIHDSAKLTEQVREVKDRISPPVASTPAALPQKQQQQSQSEQISEPDALVSVPQSHSPSPSNSQDSTLLDPTALGATASAPEHPSTPLSLSTSLSTPPRTSSPSGSVAPQPASERDRLLAAVTKLEPKLAIEVTDLLMSLSKRDRALCLFNSEVLKSKVAEAMDVLSVIEDEPAPVSTPSAPVTPQSKLSAAASAKLAQHTSPQTPDLSSSRGPSVVASPTPQTPGAKTEDNPAVYTLSSLAQLSAIDIIKLATSPNPTGLPIVKPDSIIVDQTDKFVDGLSGKPLTQQKQLLGEKLFRVVKSFGIKNSPKVTIRLLDEEDLRSLAHLMNSYPAVLKEKAMHVSSTMVTK